jgi:two-component system chemotaxis response regulator CheB
MSRSADAIVVGASAGGVQALLRLLAPLPPGFALPIAVVIHLPDDRNSRIVEVFSERLRLRVVEAADKAPLRPGTVHFAPPGYHLSIESDRSFSLSCEPPRVFSRPSIDVLFESAAHALGPRVAAVLLTGASEDGASGLATIGEAGGSTVVQDPAEAEVPTMPQAAIARREPSQVLQLAAITAWLAGLSPPGAL